MTDQQKIISTHFSPKGQVIAARFIADLSSAKLRNARAIFEHTRLAVDYAKALAGMSHGLCNRDGHPLQVLFELEEDPEPNGICVHHESGFKLQLTNGLLYQQLELYGYVASQSSFMHAFYPGAEGQPVDLSLKLTKAKSPDTADWVTIISAAWPTSPQRSQLAGNLFQFALQFVWGHELAHAQYAHLDYVHDIYGFRIFHERSVGRRTPNALMLRSIEAHADWISASQLCEVVFATEGFDKETLLCLVPIVGALLGVTWHVLEGPMPEAERSHPAPTDRALLAFLATISMLRQKGRRDLIPQLAATTAAVFDDLIALGPPFNVLEDIDINGAIVMAPNARSQIHAALRTHAPGLYENRYRFVPSI